MAPSPAVMPAHAPTAPRLPIELAPSLRRQVFALLAEVPLAERSTATAPGAARRRHRYRENRCVVCHAAGVLGGHHDVAGEVQWVHRRCHRRLHRRHVLAG